MKKSVFLMNLVCKRFMASLSSAAFSLKWSIYHPKKKKNQAFISACKSQSSPKIHSDLHIKAI